MKKLAGIALVVVVIVILAAPLVNGLLMERIIRDAHDQANALYADSGSDVTLEIVRYDRGYLRSEIEWVLKLGQLSAVYGIDEIRFIDRAKHRLTGIVSKTSLEKNPWYDELVAANQAGGDPLTITSRYHLTGAIESTIALAPVDMVIEEEDVQIGPGRLVVTSDSSFVSFKTAGTLQEINAGNFLHLSGVRISSELEKISTYIWDGDFLLEIEQGRMEDQAETVDFQAMRAAYRLDFDKKQKLIAIETELSADELSNTDQPIKRPRLRIDVTNLDAAGYERYMAAYSELAGSMLTDFGAHGEDLNEELKNKVTMTGMQLLAAGEQLLRKDLEIRVVELSATMPAGDINGNLTFRLRDDLSFMQLVPLANEPSLALQFFDLESALTMPVALIEDPAPLTAPLHPAMSTGFFVQEGELLVHRAETRDGALYLNGAEVVLD
jgi:uncharacterized protein YdgA (DUF945 family)